MRKNLCQIKSFALFVFGILILTTGCGNKLLPELTVDEYSYNSEFIIVKFNMEITEDSAKKSFTLTEDDSTVSSIIKVDRKFVMLFPENKIRKNYDYCLTISSSAETEEGYSLEKNVYYKFSTRMENTEPYILSFSPAKDSIVNEEFKELEIEFSESIIPQTFVNNFSVSPSFEYEIEFDNQNRKALIVPVQTPEINTEYKIKIGSELEDLCRNTMEKDFYTSFFYRLDKAPAEFCVYKENEEGILSELNEDAENPGLSDKTNLVIKFNEKIQTRGLSSYFSFVPSISYSTEIDYENADKIILTFNSIDWGNKYTLYIKSGIKDLAGNKTTGEKSFPLVFDELDFKNPEFVCGFFQTNNWNSSIHSSDDVFIINDENNYKSIAFNSEQYPQGTIKNLNLYLVFDVTEKSEGIDLWSCLKNLEIKTTNSCCTAEFYSMNILSEAQFEEEKINLLIDDVKADKNFLKMSVLKTVIQFKNSANPGTITLILGEEICDSLGNTLKNELTYKMNK